MKDPMRLIDRFCYKHPNFGIPNLMRYLTIANVAFWILGAANSTLLSYLSFDAALILRGQVWRLVTFMLYPPSMGMLAFLVFYFYYWMGSTLERYWGTPQFNVYILIGWALTVVYGFLVYFLGGYRIRIDAQYLYLSMFFSYAALFPDQMVLLFFIIPIKMKYLALIDAVYFVMAVVSNPFPVNLLPVVAVLNREKSDRRSRTGSITTNAPSAAAPTRSTPGWSSATARAVRGTTASVPTTSTTISISPNNFLEHKRKPKP